MDISVKFGDYSFKKTVNSWDTDVRSKLNTDGRALVDGVSLDNTFLNGREISIQGVLIKSTETALRTAFDELKAALNLGKKYLYFFDDRRILAAVDRFSWKDYPRSYKNPARCEYNIEFKAESPYWESTSETSDVETVVVVDGEYTWTINNPGSVNVYPAITIEDASLNCVLQNNTDIPTGEAQGLKFALSTTGKFIVDCVEGTVEVGDVNYIRYFAGAFLKLLPGDNSITYTGEDCTITTAFRRRYL